VPTIRTVGSSKAGVVVRTETPPRRSPVLAILLAIVAGGVLAVVLALVTARTGSEALVTGSILLAFGLGWALMAWLTIRFSGQPQRWLYLPAAALAGVGALLAQLQPGPSIMDLLGWVWPVGLAILAIWMLLRLRRQLQGVGRWLVGALVVVLLAISVAGGYMTVATRSPGAAGTGQLVDVGGRRLYLQCEGTGSPVVILQAGLGGDSTSWDHIRPVIAGKTTVCSYDRAGHGRSDDAPAPQDGDAIARDLHDLLAKGGIAGPYVVAAHSSGGPYIRVFAGMYPSDVLGMALIDPQPADAFTALPAYPTTYDYLVLTSGLAPSLARIGLLGPIFGVAPTEATAAIARSQRDEFRVLPTALDQAAKVTSIGDKPLIIVSAGTGTLQGWAEAENAQLSLSTNAAHRTIARATHDSLLDADSGASTQAIRDVLAAVREGTPVR
jgi:pimeloyl-ACP methyl ester carboxylesterase